MKYELKCKCCGYKYYYVGKGYTKECCPICGHVGYFDEFKEKEEPTHSDT